MAGFVLLKPKTPSVIEFYHICSCGAEFVSLKISQCPKCKNKDFFSVDEIENNLDKIELKFETDDKLICFYEYPVFLDDRIVTKRKILFNSENLDIKISKNIAKPLFKALCKHYNIRLSEKLLNLYEKNFNYRLRSYCYKSRM